VLLDGRRHGALEVVTKVVGSGERSESRHLVDFAIDKLHEQYDTERCRVLVLREAEPVQEREECEQCGRELTPRAISGLR